MVAKLFCRERSPSGIQERIEDVDSRDIGLHNRVHMEADDFDLSPEFIE
ncbi:MAG TPA: hypothetical protein VJ208_04150 [Candidatus Nanoarchaeia archaeon]|nr:hypothetical protein [Candidatus Nanoarchaeia archaeon]